MTFKPSAEEIAALHDRVNLREDQARSAFDKQPPTQATPGLNMPEYDPAALERHQARTQALAALQQRYPGLAIDKLPVEMDREELKNFERATNEINLQRRADAIPELVPSKHPRDMTDEEYKTFQRLWLQNKAAKFDGH